MPFFLNYIDDMLAIHVVFAGPVDWTKNITKTKLNPTAKDWMTGWGCPDPEVFWLPVPRFDKKRKD